MRTTSHLVAPSAMAPSTCIVGVRSKTSRLTAVMIGRIITATTMPAVKMVPPSCTFTLPLAKIGIQPRFSITHSENGKSTGPSTNRPQRPNTIEGTAASRSMTYANGRARLRGAYWVRNNAMPSAIGMAISRATSATTTVTSVRSRMPNRRFVGSVVFHSRLVRKLTLSSPSDGIACRIRNRPIAPMRTTMKTPDPVARPRKMRSPGRT